MTLHRLQAAGVTVVLHEHGDGLPEVVHWGGALGPVSDEELLASSARQVSPSAVDIPWPLTVLPTDRDGWEGRPGLLAVRTEGQLVPRWDAVEVRAAASALETTATDHRGGLAFRGRWELQADGVLRVEINITNVGDDPLVIAALECVLPIGDSASEALDFGGRWTRERAPQRAALASGSRVRETRRGRTGHDSPMLAAVGSRGFSNDTGEIWAVHLAWSGDAIYRTDALPEAPTVLGAGGLLRPNEIVLAPGQTYHAPAALFVWSDRGLNGVASRLHNMLRARPEHPGTPRPVTLNTWEAVYFDHEPARLRALAVRAHAIGVERFVLDDGWFTGRRDDTAGLGDWQPDPTVWPLGLGEISDTVHGLGMQFGLWMEPEMANPDSRLLREHPDWLLQPFPDEVRSWRHEYALDVARPEVFTYLLDTISRLVTQLSVDFIKWDHNRDITQAAHDGRPGFVSQVNAVYALLDELRRRHPSLEIESCASGGARIDHGVLARTDRVWASDTNDPVERLDIQRWTELLVPPELVGAHVGPPVAHTTHRASTLAFRIATALFDSFGIEWDIDSCREDELAELAAGIAAYRRLRPLLHSGSLRHDDTNEPGLRVSSVVAIDQSSAVVRVARVATGERALPALLRIAGLAPHAVYRVRPVRELKWPRGLDVAQPPWVERGWLLITGAALAHRGIRMPLLGPGEAAVLELTAEHERTF